MVEPDEISTPLPPTGWCRVERLFFKGLVIALWGSGLVGEGAASRAEWQENSKMCFVTLSSYPIGRPDSLGRCGDQRGVRRGSPRGRFAPPRMV